MDAAHARRIVVGVNGSRPSVAALRWAAGEALLRGASLHVVYVWDRTQRSFAPYARPNGRMTPQQERMAARARLAVAVRTAFGSDVPAEIEAELAEGLTARVLLDRAAGAELLVLGAAPARQHEGPAAGPVARACLGHATCPVVVVSVASGHGPGEVESAGSGQAHGHGATGSSRMSVKGRRGAPADGGP